ncbi:MAG: tetratricopeptide repeat protein [Balneolaceae bacterium]
MASILLVFGIFFTTSCALFNADTKTENETSVENYERALEDIREEIENAPDSVELKVQQAEILFQIAKSTPVPALRRPYYLNIHETVNEVSALTGSENSELKQITTQAWTLEQSNGVALLQQDDSENFDKHFHSIIAHFDNATTVLPDSLVTYTLKAATYYRHGDVNKAVETLETASEIDNYSDPDTIEKLAYLYLEAGNFEASVNRYQALVDREPENHHYKSGLANAYILNQHHQNAVALLRELVDTFPSRYEYQESLATELYFILDNKISTQVSEPGAGQLDKDDFDDVISSIDEIITIFDTLETKLPSIQNGLERTAAFYKNAAIKLSQLTAIAPEELQEEIKNKEAELLEKALPLWQRLNESSPENMDYRKNLYQVYLSLEMEEDAEAIERSLNF